MQTDIFISSRIKKTISVGDHFFFGEKSRQNYVESKRVVFIRIKKDEDKV